MKRIQIAHKSQHYHLADPIEHYKREIKNLVSHDEETGTIVVDVSYSDYDFIVLEAAGAFGSTWYDVADVQ